MTFPSASIEVRVGAGAARTFLRPAVIIGRDPVSDVVIDDPAVSLRHCDIFVGEYGTSLADCSSSNGTYYDATRIGAMLLAPGRVYTIRLGAPDGVAIDVSTNVPLRGPASRSSQTWSINPIAFTPGVSPALAQAAATEPARTTLPALVRQPVAVTGGALPEVHLELFMIGMPSEHRSVRLRKSSIRIGRSRGNDVVLSEAAEDTSGAHAELRWDGRQLWAVDLESTNGTYLEGERVTWAPLPARGRSTIRLGHAGMGIVVTYSPPTPAALPRPADSQPREPTTRSQPDADTGSPPPLDADCSSLPPVDAGKLPTPLSNASGLVVGAPSELGPAGTIARATRCAALWYRAAAVGNEVDIGVLGVAGVGKSSLLNALLAPGCQLLPAGGVGSLTAVPIEVTGATEPALRVTYRARTWLVDMLRRLRHAKGPDDDVLGTLSLLCTGDQHGVRDPDWLEIALRHALNPEVGRPPDETHATRSALARLSAFLTAPQGQRTWVASENAADFFFALRENITGQLSPFCSRVELAWPSPLLAGGTRLVDLPGVGSAHDAYGAAAARWLETGSAVLVVCDRAGLTDTVVRALRESGFAKRWAEGNARLLVAITKLDLVADDEVRATRSLTWRAAYETIAGRAITLLRNQIATAFPSTGNLPAAVPVFPVSARELQRLALNDPLDPPLLRQPLDTGFVALHDAVLARDEQRRSDVLEMASRPLQIGVPVTERTRPRQAPRPSESEPSMSELDRADEIAARWAAWIQERGQPFFERWEPTRVPVLEQLIADVRATTSPQRRELPICLLGNAGVGKSTLINALIDPVALLVPQGGVGPLTAQATVVRYAPTPYMRATYHGARRLNQLVFALDRYCERHQRAARDDDNDIDAAGRQEAMLALAQAEDAGGGEREAVEQRLRSYISQARQLVRGNQYGAEALDEVAYLADALRDALGRPAVWGHSLHHEDRERIQTLREAVAIGDGGRSHQAGADRAAFLREVRHHATGSIAPLIKSLEVGWDSELLRDGIVLVDLPGVGVANDEYRTVTSEWIRRATAVLLVVDRAGVTEPAAELLRTTGFLNALLHRAPDAQTVAPLLWVISVKLDDVAQDERNAFRQQNPDTRAPPWQDFFDEACTKVRALVRNQLDTEFAKLGDGGDELREERARANRSVLAQLEVHPVSAIEYRKLMAEDEDERPRIRTPEQSNLPALVTSLHAIAGRHASEICDRVATSLAALSASAERGLRAVLDDLEQGDRDQARLAALRAQLGGVLAPRGQELARRQGQLRERLRGTVPQMIEREVARAAQAASAAVTAYLKGLERVHWGTLRAAVRRGGVRVGNRPIDIPNELALRIEGPLAVIWNKTVVNAVSSALDEFARDLERILDEILTWAQSAEAGLDSTRVLRYRDDVVLRLRQLAGFTEATTESLRVEVKQRLHETVQHTLRAECQAFLDSGRDVGKGVKDRVHAFLADAGAAARVQAGTTAEKYLVATYERVLSGISNEFASVANALVDVERIVVGHFAFTSAAETTRAHHDAEAVRAMLADLPPATFVRSPR